jgi:formate hydrogenlyase subunit 3/multisubunit Na+/H+ antiporter MnhD subunit
MMDPKTLLNNLTSVIVNPLLALLFAIGLLVFVYGLVEFLYKANQSGKVDEKNEGKDHMLWGIIGMFIMAAAYTILGILARALGTQIP